ncbi:MAG: hypothetical protein LAP13_27070 [Acidobacteriia bacterium]|nr:hypothetical protein [Terriglobia bacterium]
MRKTLSILGLFLGFGSLTFAQHGTAPTGYYPACYMGDTWTGTLTTVDDAKRQITLVHEDPKHKRAETFVGVIEEGYTVSRQGGPHHELRPSELPQGMHLKVYYCGGIRKVDGKKTKVNTIFSIDNVTNFNERYLVFKAF